MATLRLYHCRRNVRDRDDHCDRGIRLGHTTLRRFLCVQCGRSSPVCWNSRAHYLKSSDLTSDCFRHELETFLFKLFCQYQLSLFAALYFSALETLQTRSTKYKFINVYVCRGLGLCRPMLCYMYSASLLIAYAYTTSSSWPTAHLHGQR